jgi:hypothetical protein
MINIQQINLGQYPNDGTGDDLRTAFEKIIGNFSEIDSKVVIEAENIGTGVPVAFETPIDGKLRFRTLKSGNDNLGISFDSEEIVLTVSNFRIGDLLDVSADNPAPGEALVWNGSSWSPANVSATSGVSKIIAGDNIEITPAEGVGEVTISSTGSGVPQGFDFGGIGNPSNILELLLQATPIDFGSLLSPSSLILDLGFINQGSPNYALSVSTSQVIEGQSFTVTLNTLNVENDTVIPYVITGVDSDDIEGASLSGGFTVQNNRSTLTVQTTADSIAEGIETFVLTLVGIDPPVSVIVSIVETIEEDIIDGGSPGTIAFTSVANGGSVNQTEFNQILDGGPISFLPFEDAVVDGGMPSETTFKATVDGESISAVRTAILDAGLVLSDLDGGNPSATFTSTISGGDPDQEFSLQYDGGIIN